MSYFLNVKIRILESGISIMQLTILESKRLQLFVNSELKSLKGKLKFIQIQKVEPIKNFLRKSENSATKFGVFIYH